MKLLRADDIADIMGVSLRVAKDLMRQMPRINISRSTVNPRWAVEEGALQAYLTTRTTPPSTGTAEMPMRRRRRSPSPYEGLLDEDGHIPRR